DLTLSHRAIKRALTDRPSLYLLLVNTPKYIDHPHIIHISQIIDNRHKSWFIQSCDAHIECGSLGHSFGLAIGEFSVHNKPVIAYNSPGIWNREHLDILGPTGIYYQT